MLCKATYQHGYMKEPPSRASAWLTDPYFKECCQNDKYTQMFCGGMNVQWNQNGGRCGICGDDWSAPEPRDFERGGAKYLGKIVRTYTRKQRIQVIIEVNEKYHKY